MFSAFKKLASRSGNPDGEATSPSIAPSSSGPNSLSSTTSPLSVSLQRKFGRGVHYNMKILLRGDHATGKTTLFRRLQGGMFNPNYTASEEIAVASIQWNHKATDDIVKVEIWDVVDKGKKKIKLAGLKIDEKANSSASNGKVDEADQMAVCLDAEFVDVYKGAHGVVFLFDVTKPWTFDYIRREIVKVPANLPVMVLANFVDQAANRAITREQGIGFAEEMSESLKMDVRFSESSMSNGFGLRFLHKFFSLPYLKLQREALRQQLETNKNELTALTMELDIYLQSAESNYEEFSNGLKCRAEGRPPSNSVSPVPPPRQPSPRLPSPQPSATKPAMHSPQPTIPVPTVLPTTPSSVQKIEMAAEPQPRSNGHSPQPPPVSAVPFAVNESPKKSSDYVHEFVPDAANALDFFLDDAAAGSANIPVVTPAKDEESDDEDDVDGVNPMVAKVDEDVDDFYADSTPAILSNGHRKEEESDSEEEIGNSAVKKVQDAYEEL